MSERAAEVVDTAATDWTTEGIVARREKRHAASQRKFVRCRRFACRWTTCRPSRNAWIAASPPF